ncbi:MAG: acyltransferase family protein [Thermoproteota archaeon]|nr:acyltransferase family protein [Thermoproteota archaeon]
MDSKSATVNFPVDTIRFIAIFLIIFLHSSGYPYKFLTPETTVIDIVNWFTLNFYDTIGMFGLPLFVMLTGALLLNPVKSDEPLRVFYKKRFNRIGLPFVFWTIIYFIWTFAVLDWPFTTFNVLQGLISGSYYHLWYLYVLMGLYAVTPVLRVLVKNLTRNLFTYLLILWFTGTVVTPAIHTFTDFNFNPVVFVIFDWVGYYLLGVYLINSNIRRFVAYTVMILGLIGTIMSDWVITAFLGAQHTGICHNYMSPTIILGSAALFFILVTGKSIIIKSHVKLDRFVQWVSQNTLPIYLLHMLVLITLTNGVFGVYLNTLTFSPVLDTPLFAAIVFAISSTAVYILKKMPYISRLIG